ncbi:hypothetical protein C2G38_151465 [Gigaspora rosea]|uniref:Uncharacterized protein n=1 Tax=Gigaspora rosea TaxID=44941 RepID=A0A397W716_9GLOM|nr:hypothetical protein C2G38_151465 [Gigaspora rosea]
MIYIQFRSLVGLIIKSENLSDLLYNIVKKILLIFKYVTYLLKNKRFTFYLTFIYIKKFWNRKKIMPRRNRSPKEELTMLLTQHEKFLDRVKRKLPKENKKIVDDERKKLNEQITAIKENFVDNYEEKIKLFEKEKKSFEQKINKLERTIERQENKIKKKSLQIESLECKNEKLELENYALLNEIEDMKEVYIIQHEAINIQEKKIEDLELEMKNLSC